MDLLFHLQTANWPEFSIGITCVNMYNVRYMLKTPSDREKVILNHGF